MSTTLPAATQVRDAVVSLAAVVLAALGTTDGALPELVRVETPPVAALVLAVVALCHHRSLQSAAAAGQAVADAVQAAGTLPQAPPGLAVAGSSLEAAMAEVGAYLEAHRAGVLAVPETGRHQALSALPAPAVPLDQAATDVLPALRLDQAATDVLSRVPLPPVPRS